MTFPSLVWPALIWKNRNRPQLNSNPFLKLPIFNEVGDPFPKTSVVRWLVVKVLLLGMVLHIYRILPATVRPRSANMGVPNPKERKGTYPGVTITRPQVPQLQ